MKVRDLIKQLLDQDPEAEAHLSYGYGDHWHTEVAPKIGSVESARVIHSDYHRMDRVVETADEAEDSNARSVVIVSSS